MKFIDSPAAVSFAKPFPSTYHWMSPKTFPGRLGKMKQVRRPARHYILSWPEAKAEARALEERAIIMKTQLKNHHIATFVLTCLMWGAFVLPLRSQDTTQHRAKQRQNLSTVVVRGNSTPSATLSQAPVQVITLEKMERSGAMLLSDAVKQMAGVTLKDYGGIGGMKTVSARGLSSQFSTLTIDGVAVNDCQNGQVDLGRYMIGNSSLVSLTSGLQDEMLMSARSSSAGSVINMETMQPSFMPGENTHGRIGMEAGSFGLLAPSLLLEQRLNRKMSLSIWGNWLQSRGDYPFTLYYTSSHDDSSSVEHREHSKMRMATGDINFFYDISPTRLLTAKVHYVQGYHELPGPVVFYAKRGTEDTREKLFFSQVKYTSHHYKTSYQLIGKYQYTNDVYEDSAARTLSRYLRNEYDQHEGYLSGSMVWRASERLSSSIAADGAIGKLHSNLSRNSEVQRITALATATVRYQHPFVTAKGQLLATLVGEDASSDGKVNYRRLSPYAGITVRPLKATNIRLRYFFKSTYRVPSFNEMYYFVMPLDTLRPERADQHNIGITLPPHTHFNSDSSHNISYSATIDGYRNSVHDKIIALPKQNMFIWSTLNLGLVDVTGLDIKGIVEWKWNITGNKVNDADEKDLISLSATATYSYQKAVDHTDPKDDKRYNNQIPYTPRHSGGLALYLTTPWVNVGYNYMQVGERYYQHQNSDECRMEPYADHSIIIDHSFDFGAIGIKVQAQVLNILDKQYEVVRSYPMMGRNYRFKVIVEF